MSQQKRIEKDRFVSLSQARTRRSICTALTKWVGAPVQHSWKLKREKQPSTAQKKRFYEGEHGDFRNSRFICPGWAHAGVVIQSFAFVYEPKATQAVGLGNRGSERLAMFNAACVAMRLFVAPSATVVFSDCCVSLWGTAVSHKSRSRGDISCISTCFVFVGLLR